jgi:hypothetical protein
VNIMGYRIILVGCIAAGCWVSGLGAADITVSWDPPDGNTDGSAPDNLAGYRFYYGTAPHSYLATVDVGLAVSANVKNLQQGQTYYFSVSAYNSNGSESSLADEWAWTVPLASTSSPPSITGARVEGVPPRLSLGVDEQGLLKMGIRGTVGADIVVQTSTNLVDPLAWEPLESLLLTNAATSGDGTPLPAPRTTLEAAFVPAQEWYGVPAVTSCPSQFFRVVMSYSYAVLADKVLKSKGYQTRLILVRLPGETLHDVCYVGGDGAYIDCSEDLFILALNYSGATIREIADHYGGYVTMNWTSASEFVFTNGARQLVSTVVKTDSPSSDPALASVQSSSIEIDF